MTGAGEKYKNLSGTKNREEIFHRAFIRHIFVKISANF